MAISEICKEHDQKLQELKKCSEETYTSIKEFESDYKNNKNEPGEELKATLDKYKKVYEEFKKINEELIEAIREAANH